MSIRNQTIAWLLIGAAFVAILVLLKQVLLPFVAGMAVAYFLDPVTDRLELLKISRTVATSVVLLLFFLLIIALTLLIVPVLQTQLVALLAEIPGIVARLREDLVPAVNDWSDGLAPEAAARAQEAIGQISEQLVTWSLSLARSVWSSGVAVINLIALLVITPIVSWYLLRDWDRLVAWFDSHLPRAHAETVREQVRLIDQTLAGFVRGQATVCLILGIAYAVALEVAGLQFGLVVGLLSGLISFIPYVGSIAGLILSVGLAIAQFGDPIRVAIIAGIFFVGQAIEGNFLTPNLVGDRVGLHPVWVMFALLAGGALFGFVGVLLSVPVAAVIGVLTRFAVGHYRGSALFHGAAPPDTRS